jgi:hypothetical protein
VISFRYHVFTIVAIFLAVALGIAVGNAYVQPALLRQLQNQTNDLRSKLADYRASVDRLETATGQLQSAGDILRMVDGRQLVGSPVVVVTQDGTDPAVLGQATAALEEAQAQLVTVFAVTDAVLPTDGQPHPDLARLVGMPASASPEEVAAEVADTLAERLVTGPPRRGAQPAGDDVLDTLLRGQYLRFPRGYPSVSEGDLARIGGQGEIVIALSGANDSLALSPAAFMAPFVRSLIARGATVAAGEASSAVDPFVDALRGDGDLDGSALVTVDDLQWPIGAAALVLGLERLIATGQGGDYGVMSGAEAPIPPIR